MSETRGYETINDRTAGWGPGVDPQDQPDADATPETIEARLDRSLVSRHSATPDGDGFYEFVEDDDEDQVPADKDGTEAKATGRTSVALPVSDLVSEKKNTVGSIVDRTDGWGHTGGTQADRKDS